MKQGRGALQVQAQAIEFEVSGIPEQAEMDPERVRSHVDKILGSADFAAAPQLAAFLRYIVEKTLSGEQDFIKAYTIATEALGRPSDFDAQNDPIVRVQARRLRQALLLYYADSSADRSMRIVLPVGGYVPEFEIPGSEPVEEVPKSVPAKEQPDSKPLFETRWIAPVSLILSLLSMILTLWPEVIRYVLGP
jgi:hypothetical protein